MQLGLDLNEPCIRNGFICLSVCLFVCLSVCLFLSSLLFRYNVISGICYLDHLNIGEISCTKKKKKKKCLFGSSREHVLP